MAGEVERLGLPQDILDLVADDAQVGWVQLDAIISLILGFLTFFDYFVEIPLVGEAILTFSSFAVGMLLLIAACIASVIGTNPEEPGRCAGQIILIGYCILGALICLIFGLAYLN